MSCESAYDVWFLKCTSQGEVTYSPCKQPSVHSSKEPFFLTSSALCTFLVAPSDTSGASRLCGQSCHPPLHSLHSHADPEVFFVLEGLLEGCSTIAPQPLADCQALATLVCVPGASARDS